MRNFLSFQICLLISILLVSCVSIEKDDTKLLVGTWEEKQFVAYAQKEITNTLQMKDDGTFECNFNGSYLDGRGQYRLEGGTQEIFFNIFDSGNQGVYHEQQFLVLTYSSQQVTHVFLVEELSKTKLVMRDDHQTQHILNKK